MDKSSTAGLIIVAIMVFNIACLLIYFLLKFMRHDKKLSEDNEREIISD